jgi:hypothetical protein
MKAEQAAIAMPNAITHATGEVVWAIVKGATLACVTGLAGVAVILSGVMLVRVVSLVM